MPQSIIVIGGGAAGFFAAIACAESTPNGRVMILEKGAEFLSKVRVSGGGRCNVTHACFDAREFASRFPRGHRELIGPFRRFGATETVAWFEQRGVTLKTEGDGRMFPVTDSSMTIVDCLVNAARAAGVRLRSNCRVERLSHRPGGGFIVRLAGGESVEADMLMLAPGGCRTEDTAKIAVELGHTIEPPVPSLFTFHIEVEWLKRLAGVSVDMAQASVAGTKLVERGPLLITHWGVSGPVILRLSAWGARELHGMNYTFPLTVNWVPDLTEQQLNAEFQARRVQHGAKLLTSAPVGAIPLRLWEQLVLASGAPATMRWAALSKPVQQALGRQLTRTELPVTGKSLNKEEFVTCGGIRLTEVDFKSMQSRVCPGLYLGGEFLDLDGITGGFNFQAAWTTGWLAGKAMASASTGSSATSK
jgi:hypothetical protein